jgi:3-carboxy-cis,cis-muconate cycloisomerase
MPQKSNPITSEVILAAARTNAGLLAALHNAQIQEHERGTHGWQVEWLTLPQMITLTAGALKHAVYLAENLQVDAAAMSVNIANANDVILAEAAVLRWLILCQGRRQALVKRLVLLLWLNLWWMLSTHGGDSIPAGAVDWQALARPENYLGEAANFIDAVLQQAKKLF